jgi:hypothetical protein
MEGLGDAGLKRRADARTDRGVAVFTDDVASSNYPVFKGPATL